MSPNGNLAKTQHFEFWTQHTLLSKELLHFIISKPNNVGTKKSSNQECWHVGGHAAGCSRLRLPGTFKVQHWKSEFFLGQKKRYFIAFLWRFSFRQTQEIGKECKIRERKIFSWKSRGVESKEWGFPFLSMLLLTLLIWYAGYCSLHQEGIW